MLKRKDRKLALRLLFLWLSSVLITELSQYDLRSIDWELNLKKPSNETLKPNLSSKQVYQQASVGKPNTPAVLKGPKSTKGRKSKPKAKTVISKKSLKKKVNVNLASKDLLVTIKGIGPKTADKILQHRQAHGVFKTLSDLKLVKGIGKKKLNLIKDHITFK